MSIIKNLKIEENGLFANGTFESKSLFSGEMKVIIFVDDGATETDAERCINHYNNIHNKQDICNKIQTGLEKFFLYMYDEWRAFDDIYGEIADSLEVIMNGYKEGKKLISYLSKPTLYVFPQMKNEIGYGIECECPWEPEHQCIILIRNNNVVYVGPSEGNDPWQDENEYYCIWNDED